MPDNPHQWAERRTWQGDVTFDAVVLHIRANGYSLRFGRADYRCLDVGPHRYWSMGSPLWDTRIINRAVNKPDLDTVAREHTAALANVAETCRERDAGLASDADVRRAEKALERASRAYFDARQ